MTEADPATAEADYWLSQPPTATVEAEDFNVLWEAAEAVARNYLFAIDRRDHRAGQLITHPMLTRQFFEVWRRDAGTIDDVSEASLASIRRTVHFQFTPDPAGGFSVAPKALVERQARLDPKYRTGDADEMPLSYWYALRRDPVLEGRLAKGIAERLKGR